MKPPHRDVPRRHGAPPPSYVAARRRLVALQAQNCEEPTNMDKLTTGAAAPAPPRRCYCRENGVQTFPLPICAGDCAPPAEVAQKRDGTAPPPSPPPVRR